MLNKQWPDLTCICHLSVQWRKFEPEKDSLPLHTRHETYGLCCVAVLLRPIPEADKRLHSQG